MKGRSGVLAVATVVVMSLAGGGLAGADGTKKTSAACPNVSGMSFVTDNSIVSTSTATFLNIPSMGVRTFEVSGTPGCVLVTFSATTQGGSASGGNRLVVRALLDGKVVGDPVTEWDSVYGPLWGVAVEGWEGTPGTQLVRSVTFTFSGVAPGPHQVSMQWATQFPSIFYMFNRVLVVQYQNQ